MVASDVRQVFGSRFGRIARRWRRAVDRRLQPFGLTEASWLPLLHLARSGPPMRQKDLAEAIGIDGSTLVRLIDMLDRGGLVERQVEGDRRARTVHLTPQGQTLVGQMLATTAEIRAHVLAGITDAELEATLSVMERIDGALEHLPDVTSAEA